MTRRPGSRARPPLPASRPASARARRGGPDSAKRGRGPGPSAQLARLLLSRPWFLALRALEVGDRVVQSPAPASSASSRPSSPPSPDLLPRPPRPFSPRGVVAAAPGSARAAMFSKANWSNPFKKEDPREVTKKWQAKLRSNMREMEREMRCAWGGREAGSVGRRGGKGRERRGERRTRSGWITGGEGEEERGGEGGERWRRGSAWAAEVLFPS